MHCNQMKVASAANAPTVRTSPCENLITSSTPKNSVKPTATSAYIMPSISPFMTYCAKRPKSMTQNSASSCPASCRATTSYDKKGRRGWAGRARAWRSLCVLAARQLLGRRAFAERERARGQRAETLDEGVGDDARGAIEHGVDAELVHLLADADANRRQAADIDDLRIERLDLGELGREVLLVGGDAEGADDLGLADLGERLAEVFVVALAVVGRVVDHRHGGEAELGNQLRIGIVLVDHRAVDAMNLGVLVAIGDVGQHSAPDDHREAEFVIGVDRRDRGRGAIKHNTNKKNQNNHQLGRD